MAKILRGLEAADALNAALTDRVKRLSKAGIIPCLAVVRIGERVDDIAYERGAQKRCAKAGIEVKQVLLSENVTQTELIKAIKDLNEDTSVHGVLLLKPFPQHIDDEAVCAALSPIKDVDGITEGSLSSLYAGRGDGYAPCTAAACIAVLKHYNIPIAGRHAVVIGRSLVIGKPVSMLLLNENATVTICHSRSERLANICRSADIIIAAAGKMRMLNRDYVRTGQILLDVGIHVDADGNMCGDAAFEETEPIVEAITPVPGGVGSVTTAVLASHVVEAAEKTIMG